MNRKQFRSLQEAAIQVHEKMVVLKGLNAFKKDESMIDDLENDLQSAGLKPNRDYKLDLKKGTVTIMKDSPKLKNIKRIYRLREGVNMNFSEFYKQKELDGLKQVVSRSRFMNEESKTFILSKLEEAMNGTLSEAKGKVKEDDDEEEEEDDDDDDEEESEMESKSTKKEAAVMSKANVDKALQHDCAKHVVHENLGHGVCVDGQHTLVERKDGTAYVTHYDVVFEDGMMYEDVPVKDLKIVSEMSHGHKRKKK